MGFWGPFSGQDRECVKCLLRLADIKSPDGWYKKPISKDILRGIQCCSWSMSFKSTQPRTIVLQITSAIYFCCNIGERWLQQLLPCLMLDSINHLRISLALSKNELKIPCLKKKTVWEAMFNLGGLRGKFSRCSQPTPSQGVNSRGGNSLAAATHIIAFSSEQKVLCSNF